MLIEREDGTCFTGPFDILLIARDAITGRYHLMFLEERPMPGPVPHVEETTTIRLKSKMYHTEGAPDLDGARAHLAEMRAKVSVPDENVLDEPLDMAQIGPCVLLCSNWRPGRIERRHIARF